MRHQYPTTGHSSLCSVALAAALALFPLFLPAPASSAAPDGFYTGGSTATGSEPTVRGGTSFAPKLRPSLRSMGERKWDRVVRQNSEIGCAAASLATILTYYFDFPTTEQEVLAGLYSEALSRPAPNLREDLIYRGFNLLHVRNVARTGGLVAAGFRMKTKDLPQVRIPTITRVTIRGYDHFVVFKEARNGRVFVADPSFGNTVYRLPDWERIWSGVMMGFVRPGEGAVKEHELALRGEDLTFLTWEETERLFARLQYQDPTPIDGGSRVASRSIFEFVIPQIEGLQAVFPKVIFNRIEFGEDITF